MSLFDLQDQAHTSPLASGPAAGRPAILLSSRASYTAWREATGLLLEGKKVLPWAEGTRSRPGAGSFQPTSFAEEQQLERGQNTWDDNDSLARATILLSLSPTVSAAYKEVRLRAVQATSTPPAAGAAAAAADPATLRGTAANVWSWCKDTYGDIPGTITTASLGHIATSTCPAEGDVRPWLAGILHHRNVLASRPFNLDQVVSFFLLHHLNGRFPFVLQLESSYECRS